MKTLIPSTILDPGQPTIDPRGLVRLHHFFEATADTTGSRIALDCGDQRLSYTELDERANRLAHYIRRGGAGPGTRVGILLYRSIQTYVALLATLKAGAAFVPIDPGVPAERLAFIARDAQLHTLLSSAVLARNARDIDATVIELDTQASAIETMPTERPVITDSDSNGTDCADAADPTCYIIYTSGSTGRPKGVEVSQSAICNFLSVVPQLYDVRATDRVYQGMTISFDFSIEEIWPTWAVGATLVAGAGDSRRFGAELADFLDESGITVLYCVPTLLATIPRELPAIRNLLVGGEACPGELVERWSRPGRRMLNTYGPTEATVTATWCELKAGNPVTIGRALPTYSIVLLDDQRQLVADGEVGEICIGGPGVARGYVGRPDLTAERFIEHPLAPAGSRLYRTGDLGRLTDTGDIEYLGRADSEVKLRGHRVDLGEIESVLLEDAATSSAVVTVATGLTSPGSANTEELAAYVTRTAPGPANSDAHGGETDEALLDRLHQRLRQRLPEYMVPFYLDVVAELPTMPSGKVDRSRLPAPTGRRRIGGSDAVVAPTTPLQAEVRSVWAQALNVKPDEVSVEADFFTDLGGHSLLAATVISLLREGGIGTSPTVRDLYSHPTVSSLAHRLERHTTTATTEPDRPAPLRHGAGRLALAGGAQLLFLLSLLLVIAVPVAVVYVRNDGVLSASMLGELAVAAAASYTVIRWLLPPLLTRLLTAGIAPGAYPLWGATYLRLWAGDIVLGLAPLPLLSGSAFMAPYLRLLGATVGRRTHIGTAAVSVPALLRIGDDATLGYGVHAKPWVVRDGWVVVAPIIVGNGGYVGTNCVLEPGCEIGELAALEEHSIAGGNQQIPDGQWWGGSPSTRRIVPDAVVCEMGAEPKQRPWTRRQLAGTAAGLLLLELLTLVMIAPSVTLVWWPLLTWGILAGLAAASLVGPVFVLTVCVVLAVTKALILRRVSPGIHPQRSALGVRKWLVDKIFETSLTLTNSLYATLYTNNWLRLLGARVGRGAEVSTAAYLDPNLVTLGNGCFIADMASVGSAKFYNGHVALLATEVGERAFVGNAATMPTGSRLGDGSLIGVHTVPPADGVPAQTSWLGSPAMFLPKRQDSGEFGEHMTFTPRRGRVAERLVIEFMRITLPASLIAVSIYVYLLGMSQLAGAASAVTTVLVAPLLAAAAGLAVVLFVAGTKWLVIGTYRQRVEPLWSRFVRRAEFVTGLYEAAAVPAFLNFLVGTPLLPPMLRLFGVRIGRRNWIATTFVTEFDLVRIGNDTAIGTGVSLQTHLFEDRVMKMSTVMIGDGATIGDRSIVLYDAVVGPGATLGSLSLAMKGEHLPADTHWQGIPAQGTA